MPSQIDNLCHQFFSFKKSQTSIEDIVRSKSKLDSWVNKYEQEQQRKQQQQSVETVSETHQNTTKISTLSAVTKPNNDKQIIIKPIIKQQIKKQQIKIDYDESHSTKHDDYILNMKSYEKKEIFSFMIITETDVDNFIAYLERQQSEVHLYYQKQQQQHELQNRQMLEHHRAIQYNEEHRLLTETLETNNANWNQFKGKNYFYS